MPDVFREIVIQVADVDAAVAFYRDVCGFLHIRTVEHEGAKVAEMDADGQRVSLAQSTTPGIALVLRSKNARSERRRLQRVTDYEDKPVKVEGGVWLPLADPWGNQLGFWEEVEPEPEPEPRPEPGPAPDSEAASDGDGEAGT